MTFQKRFTDVELMRAISRMKPCTAKQLAEHFGISRQGMFWRLYRLEKRGKVKRREGDRRKKEFDLWFCWMKDDE